MSVRFTAIRIDQQDTIDQTVKNVSISCDEIAEAIGAEVYGDGSVLVSSIASVSNAKEGSITFITARKFLEALRSSRASAVIMSADFINDSSVTRLVMDNPYLGYARLTKHWVSHGADVLAVVHPSSCIDESASLGDNVTVAANAVVGANTVLGNGVTIGAGAVIGDGCTIGDGTTVHPNATLLNDCAVGIQCEIHSGAVIGADGFGYAPGGEHGWEKIYQLGCVRIGDRVSIGACTTVDRGALEDTVIHSGVILDNHIQVAHNVTIGANTAIAGCTGIAGSTCIGANCRIGGAVSIVGHINICDDVVITANSFVNRSVTEAGSYSSGFPLETSREWRKNAARLHRLDRLSRQVGKLKP